MLEYANSIVHDQRANGESKMNDKEQMIANMFLAEIERFQPKLSGEAMKSLLENYQLFLDCVEARKEIELNV